MGNTKKYLITAILFIGTGIGMSNFTSVARKAFEGPMYVCIVGIIGVLASLNVLVGVAYLWISTHRIARHHSLYSALRLFVLKYHRLYVGKRLLRRIRSSFKDTREAQERLLKDIIRKNKDTAYGRQFQLEEVTSLDNFRENHPLTDYDRYEQFVERVAKGEQNVMTSERVTRLFVSSGTTGKYKLIPQRDMDYVPTIVEAVQHELFPNVPPMQEILKVHINGKIRWSEGGIAISSPTTLAPHMVRYMDFYTPPTCGQTISSVREVFYVAWLFGLRDRELPSALILFTSNLVDFMRFLKENWRDLVKDLSDGSINPTLNLSQEVRTGLLTSLGPGDHKRAMEVKAECERGFIGILKRLWPKLEFISTVDPGGLRESLKKSEAKGVELHCAAYGCSEGGLIGINFWPFADGTPEYALVPTSCVYEFIKVEDIDTPNPRTYFMDEVEIGQKYELVLTQDYGLYRFRFGDVIEVTGYHHDCPKVKVLYRKDSLLNMVGEKVDQLVVKEAVTSALSGWKDRVSLVHYCVAESSLIPDNQGPHYIFFVELALKTNQTDIPDGLTEESLGHEIQKYLYEHHSIYRIGSDNNRLMPVEVHITKPGAFNELREYMLSHSSGSRAMFKMPLKLRTGELAKEMLRISLD